MTNWSTAIFCIALFASGASKAGERSTDIQPNMFDGEAYGRAKAEEQAVATGLRPREKEVAGVPAVFTTPETGLGGGGAFIYLGPQTGTRRDFGLAGASYTERRQFLSVGYFESYSANEHWAWEASYRITDYPDYFYGVGRYTREADRELYTMTSRDLGSGIRWLPWSRLQLGFGLRQEDTALSSYETGGAIDKGLVSGALGGKSRFVILSVRYDTVDDSFSPRRGTWLRWDMKRDNRSLGSDFESTKQSINASYFLPVLPSATIGMQVYAEIIQGDAPWYQLAQAGGRNLLRGYYMGRYRDRNMAVTQGEWRQDLWGRWGWVLFGGSGQVGRELRDLTNRDFLNSAGAGIRYRLADQQRVNVRLDFGWTREQGTLPSTYLYILEAF